MWEGLVLVPEYGSVVFVCNPIEGKSRMVLIELAIVLACCGGCGLSACYPGR